MSNELEVTTGHEVGVRTSATFDASLAAERVAEKTLMRSIIRAVIIGVPTGIAFFIGLLALSVGGDMEWWVIIGLGTLLGLVAAVLFGMLAGVTLVAHTFEDVDKGISHAAP